MMLRIFLLVLLAPVVWAGTAYDVMSPVVGVQCLDGTVGGSGTLIAPNVVVTNWHVLMGKPRALITVFLWDKEKRRINGSFEILGRVRAASKEKDLIILVVDKAFKLPYALFAPDHKLDIFDPVIAVGAGYGQDIQPYKGHVTDQDVDGPVPRPSFKGLIQISSEIVPGCSGGPVFRKFDGKWRLIGIIIGGYTGSEMSFCIPISRLVDYLRELKNRA